MAEVIGVRFKNMGKVYYFDPNSEKLSADDHVVVETARGVECGEVAMANRDVADDSIDSQGDKRRPAPRGGK